MATGKKYYWIKLKETFMTSDTIDYFMSQKDGANYVVLYQMLCLKTINTEGRLARTLGEVVVPFDIEKIQRDCKWFGADTIRVALKLYQAVGLIYEDTDGVLVMTDHRNLVGSETDYASQKARQRLIKKEKDKDNNVDIVHTDIRDKRLDIKSIEKEILKKETFEKPTEEELSKYIAEKGYHFNAEAFIAFYESKGWKVGNQPMKSWKACCVTWENRHKERKTNSKAKFEQRTDNIDSDILDNFNKMMEGK